MPLVGNAPPQKTKQLIGLADSMRFKFDVLQDTSTQGPKKAQGSLHGVYHASQELATDQRSKGAPSS
jgi:hypothetical protein